MTSIPSRIGKKASTGATSNFFCGAYVRSSKVKALGHFGNRSTLDLDHASVDIAETKH